MPRGDSAGGEGSTVKLKRPPSLKERTLELKGAQDHQYQHKKLELQGMGACPEGHRKEHFMNSRPRQLTTALTS